MESSKLAVLLSVFVILATCFQGGSCQNPQTLTNEVRPATSGSFPSMGSSFPQILTQDISQINRLGIQDPTLNSTVTVLYGSYTGDTMCQMRAACVAGTYFSHVPLKALLLTLIRPNVPMGWASLFEVFNAAADQGRECDVYTCTPASTTAQPQATPRTA